MWAARCVFIEDDNVKALHCSRRIPIYIEDKMREIFGIIGVLSKLCCQPIVVYIPEREHGGWGSGFIPIQEYGSELRSKGLKEEKPQGVVRLLYSGRNHYDLLV
ncbi:hypothetical protein OROMI_029303 [Orobanche minor]